MLVQKPLEGSQPITVPSSLTLQPAWLATQHRVSSGGHVKIAPLVQVGFPFWHFGIGAAWGTVMVESGVIVDVSCGTDEKTIFEILGGIITWSEPAKSNDEISIWWSLLFILSAVSLKVFIKNDFER